MVPTATWKLEDAKGLFLGRARGPHQKEDGTSATGHRHPSGGDSAGGQTGARVFNLRQDDGASLPLTPWTRGKAVDAVNTGDDADAIDDPGWLSRFCAQVCAAVAGRFA